MSERQANPKWKTQFNCPQAKGIDLSRRINHTSDFAFDEYGRVTIESTGDVDIFEFIQAQADGTDLKSMLQYISRTGDTSPLNANPGIYADISEMPETMGEAMQQAQAARKAALDLNGKLPEELRVLGNDVETVMASEDFQEKMINYLKEKLKEQQAQGDTK